MAYIESHQSLRHHYKTYAAARALNVDRHKLIGHLEALWWWAVDNAEDGDLSGYTAADIANGAEWDGDAAAFLTALIDAGKERGRSGFVERDGSQLRLHHWAHYAGHLIRLRQANKRRREERAAKQAGERSHILTAPSASDLATLPDRTGPDHDDDDARPRQISANEGAVPPAPLESVPSDWQAAVPAWLVELWSAHFMTRLTPAVATILERWAVEYPRPWIERAFAEGTRYNARAIAYLEKMLTEWQRAGAPPAERSANSHAKTRRGNGHAGVSAARGAVPQRGAVPAHASDVFAD